MEGTNINILTVISVKKVFNFLLKYVSFSTKASPLYSFPSFVCYFNTRRNFFRSKTKMKMKRKNKEKFSLLNMFRFYFSERKPRIYSSRAAENARRAKCSKWRLMRKHKFVSSLCGINRVNHSAMNLDKACVLVEMGVKYRIILH